LNEKISSYKYLAVKHNVYPNIVLVDSSNRQLYFHSKYNPYEEIKRLTKDILINENDLIIILGCGAGYILEYLNGKVKFENIIIIQKDEELLKIIENNYFNQYLQKIKNIFTEKKKKELINFFNQLDFTRYKKITYILHPVEYHIFNEFYSNIQKQLKDIVDSFISRELTISKFYKIFFQNFFENLEYLQNDNCISIIKNELKGNAGILIGAGPSLNLEIENIKKNQNKFFIFAVDTVFDFLVDNNLNPDFVITLDPQKISLSHFKKDKYENTILLYEATGCSYILPKFSNRLFISTGFPLLNYLLNDDRDYFVFNEAGGSVATLTFCIMEYLGIEPIILIGVDLSISSGSYSFAASYFDNHLNSLNKFNTLENFYYKDFFTSNLIKVKGNEGEVYTTYSLNEYLKWFNEKMKGIKNKTIYNTSLKGGYIKNTKIKRFSEICEIITAEKNNEIIKEKIRNKKVRKDFKIELKHKMLEIQNILIKEKDWNSLILKEKKNLDLINIILYKNKNNLNNREFQEEVITYLKEIDNKYLK